jgi:hypothetical protein
MSELVNIPTPLYHYTSQHGLLGIIQNRVIWATNLLFLNDTMEFKYAVQMLQKRIENLKKELDQEEYEYLDDTSQTFTRFDNSFFQKYSGIYTCSFSERGDQLSQWRGYCPDGSGFSIGFDFNYLLEFTLNEQNFVLVQCEYDVKKQEELIDKFLNRVIDYFRRDNDDIFKNWMQWGEFLELAPRMKHPKFQEEKEWRLVSRPKALEFNEIKFRTGASMLKPYIEINLSDNNTEQFSCIPEIYLGPTLYLRLSQIAIENLLDKEKVYREDEVNGKKEQIKCRVVESEIPYRANW